MTPGGDPPARAPAGVPPAGAPPGAHEWVSFDDPTEDRTWLFDVTFLLSPWRCVYGHGCQGVLTGPTPELAQGCCSYGAHLTGPADEARVRAAARTLTDDQWQMRSRSGRGIVQTEKDGTRITRLVDGACIFLNRPGHRGGPGCALHRAASERGRPPLELKPDVCWQLPLRREDSVAADGHVTSRVGQWERRDWGEGGAEFHWWCTEDPEAFTGARPAHQELADELEAMVGGAVSLLLTAYLQRRRGTSVPLPHPAVGRPAPAA